MSTLHRIGSEHSNVEGDVIFVHGLDGSWDNTWCYSKGDDDSFWPMWLAKDLPHLAVHSLDYNASASGWFGTGMSLTDRAKNVLTRLEADGIGTRPLVFICHSLGGLVVKQVLRTGFEFGEPAWEAIAQQTRGIIFLATPHAGSQLADFMSKLGTLLQQTVTAKELKKNEPVLRDLTLWYRNNLPKRGVETLVFFETQDTNRVRVVDETSSDAGVGIPRPVDANHRTICKPLDRTSVVYAKSRQFVLQSLGEEANPVQSSTDGAPGTAPISGAQADAEREEELERQRKLFKAYPLPRVKAAEPHTLLGLERASIGDFGANELPPYIERTLDKQIDEALTNSCSVLIRGRSGVGKTRSAYEAALRLYPDARVIVPHRPECLGEILELLGPLEAGPYSVPDDDPSEVNVLTSDGAKSDCVLWLDDLERFAPHVTATELVNYLKGEGRALVATIRMSQINQIQQQQASDLTERFRELLTFFSAARPVSLDANLAADEKERAGELYPDNDLTAGFPSFVMAEQMAVRLGSCDEPAGEALVRAAADWQTLGFDGVEEVELQTLFPAYMELVDSAAGSGSTEFASGLAWALEPLERNGEVMRHASLLRRLPADPPKFKMHESLVETAQSPASPDIPETTLRYAIDRASAERCIWLALFLPNGSDMFSHAVVTAEQKYLRDLKAGRAEAGYDLALLQESQEWYDEALETYRLITTIDDRKHAIKRLGARAFAHLKNKTAALARPMFSLLVELDPEAPMHHLMEAHAYVQQDSVREAAKSFTLAIDLATSGDTQPDIASEAFLGRGDLLWRVEQTGTAKVDLSEAASSDFSQAVAWQNDPARREQLLSALKGMGLDLKA